MRVILIIEIENSRILYFVNVKSPQITNSRKSKHAKITRSTIYMVNLPSAEYTRLPNTHVSRLPSASAEYTKPCGSAQQTQNICITFLQFWTNVEDVWQTLYKFYANVLCLLGAVKNLGGQVRKIKINAQW